MRNRSHPIESVLRALQIGVAQGLPNRRDVSPDVSNGHESNGRNVKEMDQEETCYKGNA